jgi:hypothetical protein
MSGEEIQKLLGGYATDTLSEAERRALFEAALEDRELFNALAKEQALRDVLQDPSARQQLIEALGPAREPLAAHVWHRLRQPAALAIAGGMAALLIVAGLVLRQTRHAARQEPMMADMIAPRPPAAAPPSAAPLRKIGPPINGRNLRRLAPLSAGRPVDTPQPAPPQVASPAPSTPSPQTMATGALAGATEPKGQIQSAPAPVPQNLIAHDAEPRALMSRVKGASSMAPASAALAYTLLLKASDGAYSPAPQGTVLHAGDSVRLQIEPGETGYIYLLQLDANAGWSLVERMVVEKGTRYELPSTGGLQSDVPATLELLLKFSPHELPEFAMLQGSTVGALASYASGRSSKITLEFR